MSRLRLAFSDGDDDDDAVAAISMLFFLLNRTILSLNVIFDVSSSKISFSVVLSNDVSASSCGMIISVFDRSRPPVYLLVTAGDLTSVDNGDVLNETLSVIREETDAVRYFSCLKDFERVRPRPNCTSLVKVSKRFLLAATVIFPSASIVL